MKNIPKNKLEVIKMVLLMIGFILIISWDYIDVKINRSDYTEVSAQITDIDKKTTTTYRKGRRRRRTSYYLTVKYMYEGEYRYASGISRSSGEDVGDIIKLYARADGVVKRGTIEFGFIFAVIIGIVFVALVKMWKENQGYTPIPSHPRGIMVDDYDDFNNFNNNNTSGNYNNMNGNYNDDLNSSYNSSYNNGMNSNYNSNSNSSYNNGMNSNYNSNSNSNYNNDMNSNYNEDYNNNLNSNYSNNLSVESKEAEHKTQSQQTEEIPQGMRVIEIPEKYL